MIICSTSNIDLIHGQDIEGYGITDGKTDWRITNIPSITPGQTGIFSIFNSVTPTIPNISILETGTVGIGTIPSISSTSKMEILGSVNINGSYMNVSNNATSSTVLSISNNYKVVNSTPFTAEFTGIGNIAPTTHDQVTNAPTDKYMIFTNTSSIGHTFTVPVGGLNCDIFMIGGGGFGDINSGGGAGACIVAINQTLPTGPCVVFVGVGGGPGYNGNDSYIQVAGITRYRAKGGGRGGTTNTSGFIGGCGGGAGVNTTGTTTGGSPSVDNIVDGSPANIQPTITSTYAVLGNAGGNNTVINSRAGGGGIGYTPAAGGVGGNGLYQVTLAGETTPINFRTYFANGSATFGVQDGTTGNYYIGGGGSGGFSFLGGLGGGSGNNNGNQAVSNTGSGGSGYLNGSSGIIIIRYRIVTPTLGTPSIELVRGIAGDANTDYKLGNYNGDFKLMSSISNTDTERIVINSIGNVGISTNVPDNILQVGNSSRLRISNGSSDYTRIGTNDVLGTTNTRINIFGNTSVSCPGQIDYFATSTGNHVFYTTDSNKERMRLTSSGNVGIGTTNPANELHLFDNLTNNNSLIIQNNSITVTGSSAPVINPTNVSGGTFSIGQITVTVSIDRFMIFTAGTSSFTVPAGGMNCDILMIGSGGSSWNGGSGAGACIVAVNQTLPDGLCTVVVGASVGGSTQVNGQDSSISVGGNVRYLATGGGGVSGTANTQGMGGGCGGGASPWNIGSAASGGQALSANIVNATPNIGPIITSTYAVLGNAGGGNGGSSGAAGGGGGIEPTGSSGVGSSGASGGKGGDGAYQVTLSGASTPINFRTYFANNGAFGVQNGTTGNYYIGGGGGGLGPGGSQGNGGLGGGGGVNNAGIANTGAGGATGGASGSGIVIIRYRVNQTALGNPSIELIRGISNDTNTDYKIGNYSGDFKVISSVSNTDTERIIINSTGNVGIGTTNPGNILQVGNSSRLRISNGASDYTRIGTNDALGTTNTRINIFGNTSASTPGQIDYYATSTGPHVFYTTDSNTEMMRITSTGNVGIGTTNPTSKLHVNGTINGTFSGNGASITGLTASQISGLDTAISGKQATINSTAGQIIIGNGNGSTTTNTNLTFSGSTLTATNISGNGASITGLTASQISGLDTAISGKQATINSTAGQIIIGNGNGSTTTNTNLTFSGSTLTATNISGNGSGISSLNMGNVNAGTLAVARGGTGVTAFNANQILVGSFTQSGNLTWDGSSLYVNGYVNCTTYLRPSVGNGANGIIFPADPGGGNGDVAFIKYYARSGEGCTLEISSMNDADDHILLSASGGVGIGVIPASKLHVSGDILATGNITAYYSDERLKTKISNIKDPLEIINKLNGFYYTPNDLARINGITNTGIEIGLSAQEVQRVLPEIVKIAPFDSERNKDGVIVSKSGENYLTMSYERLVPVFVEAIKELERRNIELTQEIALIKEKLK